MIKDKKECQTSVKL